VASGQSATSFYLSAVFRSGTFAGLSDGELLERFASRRGEGDETSELAFAALVARHGAMVLRVCRAVLTDRHEAEDAFQATFLVLATRAASIRRGGSVGSWLHGVALRVAARARSRAARRQRQERRHAEMSAHTSEGGSGNSALDDDLGRVLQEEIGRLPDRFRAAVVLCYLEGMTHEMAAEQSGCPVGTIRSRLATARAKLRQRLTRRGVAPAAIPIGLSGSGLVSISESAALATSVPAALAEATVRGAVRIGLGKGALAAMVSGEAVALMEGVLKTMMTTKLMLLTTTVLVAGVVITGAGVAVYAAFGRDDGLARGRPGGPNPTQASTGKQEANPSRAQPPAPQAAPAAIDLDALFKDRVQAIVRDYEMDSQAFRDAARNAKTAEQRQAVQTLRGANPAFYAGALLQLAEQHPRSAAAEEALIWIVANLMDGSMAEKAKELIIRDHIQSAKLELVFDFLQRFNMVGSQATERLFREALAKNPSRKIQGLSCYHLARFLESQASFVRLTRMFDPTQLEKMRIPIRAESWGYDYEDRLLKLEPEAVERQAALFYERVDKQFGDLPATDRDRMLPGHPTTLGAAAQFYLHELKYLGIGRQAPEIHGVDLDGNPFKLSDYRGRVVALYFCGPTQLRADGTNHPAMITEGVRKVARGHANDPLTLLGIGTVSPGRSADREAFKSLLNASGLPARFWWDLDQNGKPGPILRAWNKGVDLYVLDRRGVIRYKHVLNPELFEKAVTTLLKEQKDEPAKERKIE